MAIDILPQPEPTGAASQQSRPSSVATIPQSITKTEDVDGDVYCGRPEALIAAGLLTAEQVPGWPGMPPTSVRFVDGVQQPRGNKAPHDERWIQVTRVGSKIQLRKGIGAAESDRRARARQAELEEIERSKPKPDIGIEGAALAVRESSALFKVGDIAMYRKRPVVVTGEYQMYRALEKDGEYLCAKSGTRANYRRGYICKYSDGEELLFPAYHLTNEDGNQTHLRLVARSRSAEKAAP